MILYQFSACPYCWKVKALLHYQSIAFDVVEVHPLRRRELAFTDYNKVPVLKDGETVVVDSGAIQDYLNEHYAHLAPGGEEEARWRRWVDDTLVYFLPAILHRNAQASFATFGHVFQAARYGRMQRFLGRLLGALLMPGLVRKRAARRGIADPIKGLRQAVSVWVADGLRGQAFAGGDSPNLADISVFGVLRSAEDMGVVNMLEGNATFIAWYHRCKRWESNICP